MIFEYAVKKLAMAIPTMLLVMIVIFVLVRSIPGDPALLMVGDLQDPDVLETVRREMGLDRSMAQQFGIWFGNMVSGDWGVSLRSNEPVFELVLRRFGVTAGIVLISVIIATVLGSVAGVWAARHNNGLVDRIVTVSAGIIVSTPAFWMGMLTLYIFAVWLGMVPVVGVALSGEGSTIKLSATILPIVVVALIESAAIARIMRAATLEALSEDYVAYARSKGLSEPTIMFKHVLRNAAAPTLTLIGLILGNLLGGAAVIETVFTLPGLGSAIVEGIYGRDYPVIQGALFFVAVIYLTINLAVDLIYPALDPRVQL